MALFRTFLDVVLHLDKYLSLVLKNYGIWTYLLLFVIILLETGLVITPFPGDSLLFVAGTFAALGAMDIFVLFGLLSAAAILGDTLNYWIGKYFGEKVFAKSRLFRKEYLDKTKEFYRKHGGKTIILARFIPIIRTFAPFVAGIGKMSYGRFLSFNVIGGVGWVAVFVFGGYFFGAIPFVKEHLSFVVVAIILVSFFPVVTEFLKSRKKKQRRS